MNSTPQPAIALGSLGLPGIHGVAQRLNEVARIGFKGVEILDDDIDSFATQLPGGLAIDENRLAGAALIREACDKLRLKIIVFQPFRFFEGRLDRKQHAQMINKLKLWLKIVQVLDTTMIQIPTNWLSEGTTGDMDAVVKDLTEMADLGLAETPIVRFAYEVVAWGTHYDTWQGAWELVKRVDRPNFGLCLDTFHIAGRVYGDPLAASGKTANAGHDIEQSMKELVAKVNVNKIFYIQAGDAERLDGVLDSRHPFHNSQQRPRMAWSRNARLFPCEEQFGGYLPVQRVMKAIVVELGYKGWVSMELFSRKLREPDPQLPAKYADRALESWKRLRTSLNL